MKEYTFEELGYFSERECEAIKEQLQGRTYMNFDIAWSNCAGNCTLIVRTNYEDTEKEIKNFFLHCALGMIFQLKRYQNRAGRRKPPAEQEEMNHDET